MFLANSFFDLSFWQAFVAGLSATLIGAGVGVFLALIADRQIAVRREQSEADAREAIDQEVQRQLLVALRETVTKNQNLVDQIEEQLTGEVVIFYNVDLTVLDSLSSATFGILPVKLTTAVDSLRYELSHLHRKVELQLETAYGAAAAMTGFKRSRADLIDAIHAHAPRIKAEAKIVNAMIETQLEQLD